MANGQTANYGLNQWIPEDLFLREEFNNDNSKIDEALAGLQSQITSLDGEMGTVQGDLQGKIDTTNSNLTAVKNNLQSQITALDKELGTVQSDLEGQIDTAESTAATNLATAKNDLQSKINTVSSNLTTAKNDLQTKINTTNSNLTTTNNNLTTAKNSLQSQINTLDGGKAEITFGSYTGNGELSRTISLGFTPRGVLVVAKHGRMSSNTIAMGGLAMTGNPAVVVSCTMLQIITNGFQVARGELYDNTYYRADINNATVTYHYMAVV